MLHAAGVQRRVWRRGETLAHELNRGRVCYHVVDARLGSVDPGFKPLHEPQNGGSRARYLYGSSKRAMPNVDLDAIVEQSARRLGSLPDSSHLVRSANKYQKGCHTLRALHEALRCRST